MGDKRRGPATLEMDHSTSAVSGTTISGAVDAEEISRQNEAFWDELCRTWLARIEARNFDDLAVRGRVLLPRRQVLGTFLERRFGLDLYVVARRSPHDPD